MVECVEGDVGMLLYRMKLNLDGDILANKLEGNYLLTMLMLISQH